MSKIVRVVPYDPVWPRLFESERARLEEAFGEGCATIEHVGSTSVSGLAAKPVIDILVGVPTLSVAEDHIERLESLGYHYVPEYEVELPERRYFRRPSAHPRTHHLHCVVEGGSFWRRHLAFRDALRADGEMARSYAALKLDLAERHRTDGHAYTEAKTSFIEAVLSGWDRP